MNSEEVTLYNGGLNTRCFTYIDDVVEGLIYAIDCKEKLINVANPQVCTVKEFSEEVSRHNGVNLVCVGKKREFDNQCQEVDFTLFCAPLNYTPFSKGITKVFDYAEESEER